MKNVFLLAVLLSFFQMSKLKVSSWKLLKDSLDIMLPAWINQFVEMTVFLCLICFSIYDKMQGFLDESGLFIF